MFLFSQSMYSHIKILNEKSPTVCSWTKGDLEESEFLLLFLL